MQNAFKSNFNGLEFTAPKSITTQSDAAQFRTQAIATEGSRLIAPINKAQASQPAAASGASFGMPQGGNIEFEADRAKREKREAQAANLAKARAAKGAAKEAVGTVVE